MIRRRRGPRPLSEAQFYPPRPPVAEFWIAIVALLVAGMIAGGALGYILFGSAWIAIVLVFRQVLTAVLAIAVSGTAVLGLFGVDPEAILTFLSLTLAGLALLAGALALAAGVIGALRGSRVRLPRARANRRAGRAPIRLSRRPAADSQATRVRPKSFSPSQYIVGLAVQRLPESKRTRWEDEWRRDVEETFVLSRTFYALGIWLKAAPAMLDGAQEASESKPRRG